MGYILFSLLTLQCNSFTEQSYTFLLVNFMLYCLMVIFLLSFLGFCKCALLFLWKRLLSSKSMSRVATDCPLPVMQRAQREKLSFSHFCSVFPTSERVCPGSVRAAGRFRQLRHSLLCSIVLVSVETFQLYAYLLHRVCLLICSILD